MRVKWIDEIYLVVGKEQEEEPCLIVGTKQDEEPVVEPCIDDRTPKFSPPETEPVAKPGGKIKVKIL